MSSAKRFEVRGLASAWQAGLVLGLALAVAAPQARGEDEVSPWEVVATENFEILTNAPTEPVIEIAKNLERFRAAFARLAPGLRLQSPIPARVVAFRSHETYAPYKVPSSPYVLGQFSSSLDGHYLTFHAGASSLFAVDYHEYVHYLVAGNLPAVPRWFNEGLAEYYSTFEADGESVTVGKPIGSHVAWFASDSETRDRSLDHDFTLLDVLTGEAAHDGRRIGGFYAFSWGLVHYLLSGDEERLGQTAEFLALLGEGEDTEDAFDQAFDARLGDMEDAVRDYVAAGDFEHATFDVRLDDAQPSTREISDANVLVLLGDLAVQLGRLEWGQKHYEKASQLEPSHPGAYAGLAYLLDAEERYDEAAVLWGDALSHEPREPRTYLRYGRHLLNRLLPDQAGGLEAAGKLRAAGAFARSTVPLLREADAKDAKDLAARALEAFGKALELHPGHAGAQAFFGIAHLFGEVDPGPGIEALREVQRWLPQSRGVTFYLLQLHLKRLDFEAARRLLATLGDVEPELTLQAREEIERAELIHGAAKALEAGDAPAAKEFFDRAIEVTSDLPLRERMVEILNEFERRQSGP